MPEKYQNRYRIPSARLKNWDYTSKGAYFITICTKNRKHYFGSITNGTMQLSTIGELAHQFWNEIPHHFPFVSLGNFVVMPDHFHGILIIGDADGNRDGDGDCDSDTVQTLQCNVSTDSDSDSDIKMASISPKSGSISTIIRSYKSVVTKNAHFINKAFGWQPRFHDHVIKNKISFERIQAYIVNNPKNW